MDKSAIKLFAIEARKILMKTAITQAALYGVTKDGCAEPIQKGAGFEVYRTIAGTNNRIFGGDIKRRQKLVRAVEEQGFDQVIEETAYTWFNRLIAIRFMEVNGYLPTRTRVLSSETGSNTPDLLSQYLDVDLGMTLDELEKVQTFVQENRYDDAFALLFVKQCNALNEILPKLFEKTADYMELLLKLSYTSDGVVRMLVDTIPESNFDIEKEGQVEIIGWLYQYYISEKHDQIINIYKGTIKKEDIPAATQLFTTDWVVRYMVDNSLGRYWIERHPESTLLDKLEFFVTPKDGNIAYINEKIEPQDLTFFDPCMGSGHILVYAFDVLMEIYRESGYSDKDASISILENNLFGLDIDQRAYQLAYFAVIMKARSYNRRIFSTSTKCNVAVINESNAISQFTHATITQDRKQNEIGEYLIDVFRHAKEIGSLQTVSVYDYDALREYVDRCEVTGQLDLFSASWSMRTAPMVRNLIEQSKILSRKYTVVCTNPPYMGKLESHLKDFVSDRYKTYSGDLFSVFMFRNFDFCKENGYSAFMTPFVWMFIKTYENLRQYIIDNKHITTLVQMEYSAFEEATVPICSFVLKNSRDIRPSLCFRLSDFRGGMEVQKQKVLEALANPECGYFYEAQQANFSQIPGAPVAYWASDKMLTAFNKQKLFEIGAIAQGLITGDTNRFTRLWFEISQDKFYTNAKDKDDALVSQAKWFPYNKGGDFRKWYGNDDYVVNWENDGFDIKHFVDDKGKLRSRPQGSAYYFNDVITWTKISSSRIAFRHKPYGHISSEAGMTISVSEDMKNYILGFCNSKIASTILEMLSPTLNFELGDIGKLPVIVSDVDNAKVDNLVQKLEQISKQDWDSFETSWDFLAHPLYLAAEVPDLNGGHKATLADSYAKWEALCEKRFNQLKANEEELNRIFIDIYGLQDELTPEVEDKDVTVRKADLSRDIRSLVSYAVGCMFGRYSLDVEGLAYAGGEWDDSKYVTYKADKDSIIPICDEAYFEDDIVGQFVGWMKKAFGQEKLEENLDFIAKALGNKGTTSREVIRNYFLNDFMKDHMKIYQKRPIYWMFDSGKQNGFKCLIYMHRYDKDTVGRVRSDYLRKTQDAIEATLKNAEYTIQNSSSAIDKANATKKRDKYIKQLAEIKTYYQAISHVALQRIDIDLDDGVKVNYEKFQNIEIIDENGKKQKINLLTKI